jgi:hypothetical protein
LVVSILKTKKGINQIGIQELNEKWKVVKDLNQSSKNNDTKN